MPRTNEQNKEIKDLRKAEILQASVELFSVYREKVSINQICDRAKCSHGLFYHYYRDVDDVISDIQKSDHLSTLKNTIISNDTGNSLMNIKQSILLLCEYLKKGNKNELFWLLIMVENNDNNSYRNWLIDNIKTGQLTNEITPGNPIDISNIYLYTIIGVLHKKILQKQDKMQIPPVDNLIQIFIKKTTK